jgi:hypothetical protein
MSIQICDPAYLPTEGAHVVDHVLEAIRAAPDNRQYLCDFLANTYTEEAIMFRVRNMGLNEDVMRIVIYQRKYSYVRPEESDHTSPEGEP